MNSFSGYFSRHTVSRAPEGVFGENLPAVPLVISGDDAIEHGRLVCKLSLRTLVAHHLRQGARTLLVLTDDAGRLRENTVTLDLLEALSRDPATALRTLRTPFFLLFADSERGDLVWATDRAATRSPCYSIQTDRIAFGLTAQDVERAIGSSAQIRPQGLYDYFYFHVIPGPLTFFEGIRRLLPGQYLHVKSGAAHVLSYWTPAYNASYAPSDFETAKAEFRQLLSHAVAAHVGAEKTGAFLSGGTDSSTVAGMLCAATDEPPNTYSIGFDEPGFDEIGYARIAARHFNTNHHEYYLTADDVLESIPAVAASYDQPFGNSSAIAAYHCARLAAKDGVKKLLGGDGGDELFGGNTRYAKQKAFDAYASLPRWLTKGVAEPILLGIEATARIPIVKKGRSYIEQARIPMPARLHSYNVLSRIGVERIFDPAFLQSIEVDVPAALEKYYYDDCDATDLVNRMLHFDWKFTLADNDLPKVVGTCDLAGMTCGFPLLDDRMVDFANRLPSSWKVRGMRLRYFFKRALADFLPPEIITKKKHGFGLPFGVWLVKHAGLHALAEGSLESLRDRGIVRSDFLDELLGGLLKTHSMFYGELVWVMIMLDQWLRSHRPDYRFS